MSICTFASFSSLAGGTMIWSIRALEPRGRWASKGAGTFGLRRSRPITAACAKLAVAAQPLCQNPTTIFVMTDLRTKRPRTRWLGRDSSTRAGSSRSSTESNTEGTPKPIPATNSRDGLTNFNCYEENPWSVYEPRAKICRKQPITLAQHRKHRQNIVNIRCLPIDRPQVQSLLEMIRRLSHPIFPRLLESYYHTGELHLIWEPVEITVNYILTARWPVNETDLAHILRLVSVASGYCATGRQWILTQADP